MTTRENIQELNDHLQAFPKAEDIFTKDQQWLKNHFIPLMSIDLVEINPKWAGQKVYILFLLESYGCYIVKNENKYHNEYTAPNWFAFQLTGDNKFDFLGEERFFERTAIHHWDFNSEEERKIQEYREYIREDNLTIEKKEGIFQINYINYDGKLFNIRLFNNLDENMAFHNWSKNFDKNICPKKFHMEKEKKGKTDETKVNISYKGNPFYFITSMSSHNLYGDNIDAIIMFYEPVSRIVLFTFDYS